MTVINAFIFFNELAQLEVRLNELYDVVDYFILSESTKTHSQNPKPLFYNENKDYFKKFQDKIIHQIIDDTPNNYDEMLSMHPKNELHKNVIDKVIRADWFPKNRPDYVAITYESECLIRAMDRFDLNDILILDEADEIPRKNVIESLIPQLDLNEIYNLENDMYFYYFNCLKEEHWFGNTILTLKNFKQFSLCELRMRRRGFSVSNAGWHFSYMGGADKIKYKIESHAEQMLNTSKIKDSIQDNIDNCITNGHDLYFRPSKFSIVPITLETHPLYIVENQNKFKDYIK